MIEITRIFINEPRYTPECELYEVRLASLVGPVLVKATRVPLCDSARALLARGIRGRVELWDRQHPYPRMLGDIETLARLTVREDEVTSPRFVVWKPFSRSARKPKTAIRRFETGKEPETKTAEIREGAP